MNQRPIKVFVGCTVVLAMGALAIQDWSILGALRPSYWFGFSVLVGLGLLSEMATLSI